MTPATTAATDFAALADKAIAGEALTRGECASVLRAPDADVPALQAETFRVRRRFCGLRVHLHVLMNAKSGLCPEDCGYCSQSRVSTADIERYPMVSLERLLEGARAAKRSRARRFCIVTSGRGASWREVNYLSTATRSIREEVDIDVCACVGLLDEEKARALREAGVDRLNHNLNSSERFTPSIVTTHTYRDRVETLRAARDAGLSLCSGAIFGMGETDEDAIDVLLALREMDPDSIPVNFLHPIEGTPLAGTWRLTPLHCLRILCLARLLHPRREIRVAGGRELHLRSLQPLAMYAANSIFVEGYLTTPGQGTRDALQMIEDLGFEVEEG